MANTDLAGGGMMPIAPGPDDVHGYSVDSGNATAIFPGDLVIGIAGGGVAQGAAGDAKILGVAASYLAGSVAGTVYVYDNPDQTYIIQDDGDTTTSTITVMQQNADVIYTQAGNSTTGRSGMELDISTVTSATAQVRLLGKSNQWDAQAGARNAWGSWCKTIVRINESAYRSTTGTV